MKKIYSSLVFPLSCAIYLVPMSSSYAAVAGAVAFATGKPIATNEAGDQRVLRRGRDVLSGDAIKTGKGLLHIRFTDGSFMSLKPNSDLSLEEYHFNGEDDGSERQILSLVKGGFRTISGVIGKKHRENYQLKTPLATIGIRGTKYRIDLTNGLVVFMGEDGAIIIQSDTGTYQITALEVAELGGKDAVLEVLTEQGLSGIIDDDNEVITTVYTESGNKNDDGGSVIIEEALEDTGFEAEGNRR